MYRVKILFIIIFLILFLVTPSMITAGHYSFSKFTWSKATFIASGTVCISSLISGLYYQKLSDDAYENYKSADHEASVVSYRVTSKDYNSQSIFWKNVSIASGSIALISAGLDYFIFGQQEETHISFSCIPNPSLKVSMKF